MSQGVLEVVFSAARDLPDLERDSKEKDIEYLPAIINRESCTE